MFLVLRNNLMPDPHGKSTIGRPKICTVPGIGDSALKIPVQHRIRSLRKSGAFEALVNRYLQYSGGGFHYNVTAFGNAVVAGAISCLQGNRVNPGAWVRNQWVLGGGSGRRTAGKSPLPSRSAIGWRVIRMVSKLNAFSFTN